MADILIDFGTKATPPSSTEKFLDVGYEDMNGVEVDEGWQESGEDTINFVGAWSSSSRASWVANKSSFPDYDALMLLRTVNVKITRGFTVWFAFKSGYGNQAPVLPLQSKGAGGYIKVNGLYHYITFVRSLRSI